MYNYFAMLTTVIEILILWAVVYYTLIFVSRNLKVSLLIKGIFLILIARIISGQLNLITINWLIDIFLSWGSILIIILFSNEIKEFFINIGRNQWSKGNVFISTDTLEELKSSLKEFSKNKVGALITIEHNIKLDTYIEGSTILNSDISRETLSAIFNTNSPLHDGSVIIRNNKILAASVFFPLQRNKKLSKKLGTRHLSAVSFSEITDATIIIVSEETGSVSIAYAGKLQQVEKIGNLEKEINELRDRKEENNEKN